MEDTSATDSKDSISEFLGLWSSFRHVEAAEVLGKLCGEAGLQGPLEARLADLDPPRSLDLFHTELALVQEALDLVEDQKSWTIVHADDELKTMYRPEKGTPFNSIKTVGTSKVDFFSLVALMNEIDLLPIVLSGIPGVKIDVKELKYISPFRRIAAFGLYPPFPMAARSAIVEFRAFDCTSLDRKLVVDAKSVSDEYLASMGIELPEFVKRTTRIDVNKSAGVLKLLPDKPGFLNIGVVVNIDLKMSLVPTSFINFLSKVVAYYVYKAFVGKATSLESAESEHSKRIATNRTFYGYLETRIKGLEPEKLISEFKRKEKPKDYAVDIKEIVP